MTDLGPLRMSAFRGPTLSATSFFYRTELSGYFSEGAVSVPLGVPFTPGDLMERLRTSRAGISAPGRLMRRAAAQFGLSSGGGKLPCRSRPKSQLFAERCYPNAWSASAARLRIHLRCSSAVYDSRPSAAGTLAAAHHSIVQSDQRTGGAEGPLAHRHGCARIGIIA